MEIMNFKLGVLNGVFLLTSDATNKGRGLEFIKP